VLDRRSPREHRADRRTVVALDQRAQPVLDRLGSGFVAPAERLDQR